MGAALSIFVLLSASVFVIRIASVALRLTGLPENIARFQALSAFSGTGFTTTEAEEIVAYPVRRRIASVLMIIGNLGLVGVLAALITSMVQTDGEPQAILIQLAWLIGGLALLWFVMLNDAADRLLCATIDRLLKHTTELGRRNFQRLLQVDVGYSVCEHPASVLLTAVDTLEDPLPHGAVLLGIRSTDGSFTRAPKLHIPLAAGDLVVVFAPDTLHESLSS